MTLCNNWIIACAHRNASRQRNTSQETLHVGLTNCKTKRHSVFWCQLGSSVDMVTAEIMFLCEGSISPGNCLEHIKRLWPHTEHSVPKRLSSYNERHCNALLNLLSFKFAPRDSLEYGQSLYSVEHLINKIFSHHMKVSSAHPHRVIKRNVFLTKLALCALLFFVYMR